MNKKIAIISIMTALLLGSATDYMNQPAERDQRQEIALEVSSMKAAGYTLAEVCAAIGATTDSECEEIEALYINL
jgi:hypothetical protein